jgi:hypothetical protein
MIRAVQQRIRTTFAAGLNLALLISVLCGPLSRRAHAMSLFERGASTQDNGWTALKTDDGVFFIWNRPTMSFTLAIKGTNIQPMDAGDNIFFKVDGLTLQIQSLPISNFAPDARKNKLDDKSILIAHRDWEANFIEQELIHKKISVVTSSEKLANGSDILIWQYEMPEGFKNPDAQKQMYVTVVAKDYLILLNGVVSAKDSDAAIRSFLLDKLSTLKISSTPIDVKKIQEAIRAGRQP